jgi:hypothetical protein
MDPLWMESGTALVRLRTCMSKDFPIFVFVYFLCLKAFTFCRLGISEDAGEFVVVACAAGSAAARHALPAAEEIRQRGLTGLTNSRIFCGLRCANCSYSPCLCCTTF